MRNDYSCIDTMRIAGISFDDACAFRRISMTLHRWHELECGDGDNHGSWAIVRGDKIKDKDAPRGYVFKYDDDGRPFLEHQHYLHGRGQDFTTHSRLQDRERGALKRLAAIIFRYPGFAFYVQGDPRGCALYILRPDDLKGEDDMHSCYTRGIAVYR